MTQLKMFCFKLLKALLIGLGMLGLGFAVVFCMGWAVELVAFEWLVANNVVLNSEEYWQLIQMMYVVIMFPPIYVSLFRTLPDSDQESIKNGATVLGVGLLAVGDWIGKGVLLVLGGYYAYIVFIA